MDLLFSLSLSALKLCRWISSAGTSMYNHHLCFYLFEVVFFTHRIQPTLGNKPATPATPTYGGLPTLYPYVVGYTVLLILANDTWHLRTSSFPAAVFDSKKERSLLCVSLCLRSFRLRSFVAFFPVAAMAAAANDTVGKGGGVDKSIANIPDSKQKMVLMLDHINVDHAHAGWRPKNRTIIDLRKQSFEGGQWNLCVGGADFSVLAETDEAGMYIPDDGLQSICALKELYAEYIDGHVEDDWDDALKDIFDHGVSVSMNNYPKDSSKEARMVYMAGKHHIENNVFAITPLWIILEVAGYAMSMYSKKRCDRVPRGAIRKVRPNDGLAVDYGKRCTSEGD